MIIKIIKSSNTEIIQKMAAHFTRMFIKDKKTTNKMVLWLSNEANKNKLLPQMPFEMWRHILSFVPEEKRKDAVILGNRVVIVSQGGGLVKIQSKKWFIRENGIKALNKIHRKTFGSKREDEIKSLEIYSGRLKIETVLDME